MLSAFFKTGHLSTSSYYLYNFTLFLNYYKLIIGNTTVITIRNTYEVTTTYKSASQELLQDYIKSINDFYQKERFNVLNSLLSCIQALGSLGSGGSNEPPNQNLALMDKEVEKDDKKIAKKEQSSSSDKMKVLLNNKQFVKLLLTMLINNEELKRKGYVPTSNSGVTISVGLDLKDKSPEWLLKTFGKTIADKLRGYYGPTAIGNVAKEMLRKKPLELTDQELITVTIKYVAEYVKETLGPVNVVIRELNLKRSSSQQIPLFEDMDVVHQTLLITNRIHQGNSRYINNKCIYDAIVDEVDGKKVDTSKLVFSDDNRRSNVIDLLEKRMNIKPVNSKMKDYPELIDIINSFE